jgi:voltage-gated potassium channel
MILLFFTFIRLLRDLKAGLKDPTFQLLGISVIFLLIGGTIFYSNVEHWKVLDSLYFCVITLTTIGYGDFTPHTALGKIFTIFYVFIGGGTLVSFVTLMATMRRKRSSNKVKHLS